MYSPNFYNPYLPQYQNMYSPQQQQQPAQSQQINQNNIVRVNGIDGAKAYQMGANSSVILIDEQNPIIYFKVTDGASFPSITAYDITPHIDTQKVTSTSTSDFVTRAEFEELKGMIEYVKSNFKLNAKQNNVKQSANADVAEVR